SQPEKFKVCGINLRNVDLEYMIYMIRYDSLFGQFKGTLDRYEDGIIVNGEKIPVYGMSDATEIPWKECGAEYIIDATGAYCTMEKAQAHIQAGAKKVIMSAPAKDEETPTFVMGVNHMSYTSDMNIISNASCTTNCLAPLCKILEDNYGIEQGLMSTIHSATAKQKVVDCRSLKDWRTGRSALGNVIPTTTGAAKAVAKVIPSLKGRMTGISYRVPTSDVSLVDLNIMLKTPVSYEEICRKVKEASQTTMKGIIEYVDDEVVSSDFVGDSNTCIFDSREGIELNDTFFKFICFYDNEWGYSSQIFHMIEYMHSVD
ncbi:MAG: type I glyceraldehyde-3-phosphate dehydrogenase, partial [Lachnospiraceae bacterium]